MTKFEKLIRSRNFRALSPSAKIRAMIVHKPFAELVAEGHVYTVHEVVRRTGYTRQHVYRLIRSRKLGTIVRGLENSSEVTYYFLPEQIDALFREQKSA